MTWRVNYQAPTELHPPHRRLKILLQVCNIGKQRREAIETYISPAPSNRSIDTLNHKATPGGILFVITSIALFYTSEKIKGGGT